MRDDDILEFTKMLDATCAMLSRGAYKPNATSSLMFFRALQRFSFDAVQGAFSAHVADPVRGKFVPTPADIIAQLEDVASHDGRPDAEEAWALSFRALDEAATVVWTAEMAEAYGTVKPLLDAGDEVGARMAFKSTYSRLVSEARARRSKPSWSASLGHSKTEQIQALKPHVELGRLPASMLQLSQPSVTLLELSKSPDAPAKAREALMDVRNQILARRNGPSLDFSEKTRTSELKAQASAAVEQYESAMRGAA
jgi:hypothetical protein